MTRQLATKRPFLVPITRVLPGAILGLFAGRILCEWLLLPLPAVILLNIASVSAGVLLYRNHHYAGTWPLFLLLGYILYPYPDPTVALICGGLVLVTQILLVPQWNLSIRIHPSLSMHLILPLALVVGSLLLYLATLAPDILPADSGEFQLIATKLGLAHPPGFPLYTMLTHLLTKIPIGATPAWRVNLFSVITSTLTLLVVYLAINRWTKSQIAAVISSVALGLSTTFWSQATTANVRSLTTLFTAILFLLFIAILRPGPETAFETLDYGHQRLDRKTASQSASRNLNWQRALQLPIFILALVAGVSHHASLIFIGVILLVLLLLSEQQRLRRPRSWIYMLVAALVALLPLVYIPLRDSAAAIGSPGNINTLNGFLDHVLARGFSGDFFYFTDPSELLARLKIMANVLTYQFPPLILILMAAGLVLLAIRDRAMFLALGGTFITHTLVSAVYRAPQTVEYMLPATIPAVLLLGYFIAGLDINRRHHQGKSAFPSWRSLSATLIIILAVFLVATEFRANYASYRWLHNNRDAREYAQPLLEDAPENATVLAGWHWVTPMRYLQTVEGIRPDLDIQYVFPTAERYFDTWSRRINEELARGRDVVATHYNESAFQELPPFQPIGEGFLFRQTPLTSVPAGFNQVDTTLDDLVGLSGFRQIGEQFEVGQEFVIEVAWQRLAKLEAGTTLFMHLVGSDGRLYAQDDLPVQANLGEIAISQFRLTPRPGSAAGLYSLYMGVNTPADDSVGQSPTRFEVAKVYITPTTFPRATENPTNLPLSKAGAPAVLIGYDWDTTINGKTRLYLHWQNDEGYFSQVEDVSGRTFDLPDLVGPWGLTRRNAKIDIDGPVAYIPFGQGITWMSEASTDDDMLAAGQEVPVTVSFSASQPVLRDQVVSLRLVGYEEDGFHWAWWDLDDGVPAMGAIPTLKWIANTGVNDPHWLLVDPAASPGQQVEPLLRLYDAFTNRPLPILDERITDQAPWIPLGRSTISD